MDSKTPAPASLLAEAERRAWRQAGMTLLEIMIVLAIIALVMGFLVGPMVYGALGKSKVKTTHAIVKKLAYEAYPQWSADNPTKGCPDSLSALSKYSNTQDMKDGWGNEYVMLCGDNAGEVTNGSFGVMSKGGNPTDPADDIKSWTDAPSE